MMKEFQKKCLGKMKTIGGHGRTVIFVSHNLNAIKTICSRCIVLDHGKIIYDGKKGLLIEKPIACSIKNEA